MNISYIDTEFGKIKYSRVNDYIEIIEYTGKDLCLSIPELIDDAPVKVIKKKAFLSQKFVKEIVLPSFIEVIEDYAFARCSKLTTLYLPYKNIKLGQDILKDCNQLTFICNSLNVDAINEKDDVAFLLAKTINELNAFFLFDLKNAGTKEWLMHLDATIGMRLEKDDMEDFSKMILCGEEEVVCGEDGTIEDSNPDHYKSNRVKEKIRIAFLRLLHNYMLDGELEMKLKQYLLDHSKGQKTDETWQVVLNEHGDEKAYYDYLLSIGAINDNNFELILNDMGNRYTEIKSYLIKWKDENSTKNNMFSEFDL